jgi:hypothetical protein
MSRWCRWLGHKRKALDGDSATVSIRNVDVCLRCGQLMRAKKARDAHYIQRQP